MVSTYYTEYRKGMDYGAGINSVTGAVLGQGVEFSEVTAIENAGGQEVSTDLLVIKSQEEFQQALDINVSVNGQYGLFGGNAKFDFASKVGYQSESTFIVARVVVKNAFTKIKVPVLNASALKLIEEGKWERLREQMGDVFVRGFDTGGEFYGVLEISSSSKSAQKKIAAQLQMKYGTPLAGIKVDSSMELNESEKSADSRISINVMQNGGKGSTSIADANVMLERYKEFPSLVTGENARAISAMLQSYRTLDLPKEPNFIDVQKRIAVLQDRAIELNEIIRLRSEVKYVLQNQSYFETPNIDELNTVSTQLASLANNISKGASECANDTLKCDFSNMILPKIVLPKRLPDAPLIVAPEPTKPFSENQGNAAVTGLRTKTFLTLHHARSIGSMAELIKQ